MNDIKEWEIKEHDRNNMMNYIINSEYSPEASLVVDMSLKYEFDMEEKEQLLIKKSDLQLMVNSIFLMSKEIDKLRRKR